MEWNCRAMERPRQEANCPQAETKRFSLALIQILGVIKARGARQNRRACTCTHAHLWSEECSLYTLCFFYIWPGAAHVNSRGKTVTDFQVCSRSKSRPQVRDGADTEVWSHAQPLTYTLAHPRAHRGHIRASSITCGWPRIHIKAQVKFIQLM